jgi:hypothetical protein
MSMSCPPRIPGVDPYVQSGVHEIGHALVSGRSETNAKVLSIDIWEQDGHVVGTVISEIPETPNGVGVRVERNSWVAPEDLYGACVSSVAGHLAEAMWLVRHHDFELSEALAATNDTAWFDQANFRRYADLLRPTMPDISVRGCRAEAGSYLKKRWSDVERLGKKLANRHSLRPSTVAA